MPWGSLAIVSKVKRALSRISLTLHSVIKRPREGIAADRTVLKMNKYYFNYVLIILINKKY